MLPGTLEVLKKFPERDGRGTRCHTSRYTRTASVNVAVWDDSANRSKADAASRSSVGDSARLTTAILSRPALSSSTNAVAAPRVSKNRRSRRPPGERRGGTFTRHFPKSESLEIFSLRGRAVLVHRLAYNGDIAAGQLDVFQGASEAPISELIRVERATRKNSQVAAAQRVALKMGRQLRCSSVTYRFRYAPSSRLAGGPF